MNKILFSSIKEVRKKINAGEIRPSEILKASRKLIDNIKPLNAYISVTSNLANQESEEKDEKLENKVTLGDLQGIPVAIKDNFCTEGVSTTCGSLMLANFVPGYDATVCSRLKKSGAILIGKTNLDQFAMGSGTVDSFFGPTKNVWGSEFMDYYCFEEGEMPKTKESSTHEDDWYIAGEFRVSFISLIMERIIFNYLINVIVQLPNYNYIDLSTKVDNFRLWY